MLFIHHFHFTIPELIVELLPFAELRLEDVFVEVFLVTFGTAIF